MHRLRNLLPGAGIPSVGTVLRILPVPLALLFFGLVPALGAIPAQRVAATKPNATPSIFGQVVVTVPNFTESIEIFLEYETGKTVYTHVIPSQQFSFYDLVPGTYYLLIDVPGFQKVREPVDVIRGLPHYKPILLVPEQPEARSAGAATVNVDFRRKYSRKAADEFEKGQDELAKGNFQKAAERLAAAVKEAPTFFEAQQLLGTVYYRLGQLPDAERAYRKARELNSQSTLPLISLGSLLIEAADKAAGQDAGAANRVYRGAYALMTEAVKLDPQSSMATFLLGVAAYRSSQYDEAETHLKRAVELNGRAGQARIMLANVYIRKEDWSAALQQLDTYLKDHPTAPEVASVKETWSRISEKANASRK